MSDAYAGEGKYALKVNAAFPGGRWTGVYVEHEMEVTDWSPFGVVSLGVLLPESAPNGLTSRIILTTGDQWAWNEMSRGTQLIPGQWTTVSANLRPGSMDWKFFPDDKFRSDVRKLGIRVESNHGPAYEGPIYIDNIRMGE